MKKLLAILAVTFMLCSVAYAAEVSTSTAVSVTVNPVFGIEFYTDTNVADGSSLGFPTIDSSNIGDAMILPTGRSSGDGLSDAGILCLSNTGEDWALQINLDSSTAGLTSDNLAVYVPGSAYYRNDGTALGSNKTEGWYQMWDAPESVYIADEYHVNNTPFGTLMTFSYAILPQGNATINSGLATEYTIGGGSAISAATHAASVKYTMTTTF